MIHNPSLNWKESGHRKPGRKMDFARAVIQRRFGLTDRQMRTIGPNVRDQIVRIADTAAIRLLLGISR